MSDPNDKQAHETSERRLPYEPPRVIESAEFENLAMACGKAPTTSTMACQQMPSSG